MFSHDHRYCIPVCARYGVRLIVWCSFLLFQGLTLGSQVTVITSLSA